jgi:hypothetical protein
MRALSDCAHAAAACVRACRNDTIGGPLGRRGDRVGGPYYMHRDDLKFLAPQWLNYTHIMRNDMEVRQLASQLARVLDSSMVMVCQRVRQLVSQDRHLPVS